MPRCSHVENITVRGHTKLDAKCLMGVLSRIISHRTVHAFDDFSHSVGKDFFEYYCYCHYLSRCLGANGTFI